MPEHFRIEIIFKILDKFKIETMYQLFKFRIAL